MPTSSARSRPGKLADILVVDGDVLADIAVLEDRSRFIAVMQGGVVKAGQLRPPLPARGTALMPGRFAEPS